MSRSSILILCFILIASCQKKENDVLPAPKMKYIDLHQSEVNMSTTQRIDVDEDGTIDFSFKTYLIGDPILKQDRHVFVVGSTIETYLLAIDNTETGKRMEKGDLIGLMPPSGFEWFQIAQIVMTEKVISESNPNYWRGEWKDASHHFLPIQVRRNGLRYNGWIETSMDTNGERMILHKAAISTEAHKDVRAGY